MTLFYPDCSNNNWSSVQDAISFLEQLVPEGFSGMCHKVSEGNYYEDPYWPPVRQWCQQHNLPVIGYHYVTTDDPASQVRTWHANNGGTRAMLDWEDNGGDLANLTAVVDAFNAAGIIVRSTIALAHNLGKKVIAEGVENAAAERLLREMGCDIVQGYHLARPMPLDELIAWIHRHEAMRLSPEPLLLRS